MKSKDWIIYGANLKDLAAAVNLAKRKLPTDADCIMICEKMPGRQGFADVLNRAKVGDGVFVTALQTLKDGNSYSTVMEKISMLEGKGISLKVGLQENFSFEDYKIFHKVYSELDKWEGIYGVHYEVEDDEIEFLEFPENHPDISFYTCEDDSGFYIWS